MTKVFSSAADFKAAMGQKLGPTDWILVDQKRIDTFADATGDHQWIHVDPVRAKDGPFGATIAHGFLTLSLIASLMPKLVEVRGMKMGINYGTNKTRFPGPVRVNSKLRAVGEVVEVEDIPDNGAQVILRVTMEIEGGTKPVCVVDKISRYYW
jgi:acyl dehydratase